MTLVPPYTQEQRMADFERMTLTELMHIIDERGTPRPGHIWGIQHLRQVFRYARDTADHTGTRERFIEWFGEQEATRLITTFDTFIEAYWKMCKVARKLLPFIFGSAVQEAEIKTVLTQLHQAIDTHRKGFVVWPPPRIHPCV